MAFKYVERHSGVLDLGAMFEELARQSTTTSFEELINNIKECDHVQRVEKGQNALTSITNTLFQIFDEESFWQNYIPILHGATMFGCYGLDNVTQERKDEVLDYLVKAKMDFLKESIMELDYDFFDDKYLNDDYYKLIGQILMIENIRTDLLTYMLLVACAGNECNEEGINLISKLRKDFTEYLKLREENNDAKFMGTIK